MQLTSDGGNFVMACHEKNAWRDRYFGPEGGWGRGAGIEPSPHGRRPPNEPRWQADAGNEAPLAREGASVSNWARASRALRGLAVSACAAIKGAPRGLRSLLPRTI